MLTSLTGSNCGSFHLLGDCHFERRWGEQSVGSGGERGLLPAHVWTEHWVSGSSGNDAADGDHEIPERWDLYNVTTVCGTKLTFTVFFH